MTEPAPSLEWLSRISAEGGAAEPAGESPDGAPPAADAGDEPQRAPIDRRALAGLLLEVAREVAPTVAAPAEGVVPTDPRLELLRRHLMGREIEVISRLTGVVEDPEKLAETVGEILPTAIAHASSGTRLGQVLAPALERATESSIRRDPHTLVGIIHPLIVPAIRKSIGEAIDQTFQRLNESLRYSLTWRGLRWRFEAWRTGVSFAEIVLKHTLVYQVEHAFLIHRETGLLIAHVAAPDAASQDPLLVSSMLTAIQDFVRDSFHGAAEEGLDALRFGELRLWSAQGPHASLVAVIRGNPPEALHETIRETLAQIHGERRQALESFAGDSAGLADVHAHLAELTALRQVSPRHRRRRFPWFVILLGLPLLGLVGAGGVLWWQERAAAAAEQSRWESAIAALRSAPGIVVTEARREGDRFVVAGLRDPLAADPDAVLSRYGIDARRLVARWAPYEGLDPEFVLRRLEVSLEPPPSVRLAVEDGRIVASGTASARWLERARLAARLLPAGSPGLDVYKVVNEDEAAIAELLKATKSLRKAIEKQEIHFASNEPLPAPGQDDILDQLASNIKELAALAASLHVPVRVTLAGHSDDTGKGTFNLSLSGARADAVLVLLKKRGVDPDVLAARGAGPLDPLEAGSSDAARTANRRVSFRVAIEDQP